jgi:DNA-directed RNA polymerase sigma subunit (sigma70/sigma32)
MADAPASGKQFEEVASKVLDVIDRPREREVVERRFGLTGAKETLESGGHARG